MVNIVPIILTSLFLGLPVIAVIWFIVSLILFLSTPKDSDKRKSRRTMLIVSAIVAGILAAIIIGIVIMFSVAIAHM